MSIYVDNLEPLIMANANSSDEIIIISGFFSIDIIENIAKKRHTYSILLWYVFA